MTLNLYLGSERGGERKDTLRRLAAAAGAIGPRGEASVSELNARLADAAEFDFAQAAYLLREIMNLAAQGYVVAAEDMAQSVTAGRYVTERAAKRAADPAAGAVVVRFGDGSFDWFPAGSSIDAPAGQFNIVARRVGRTWKRINM